MRYGVQKCDDTSKDKRGENERHSNNDSPTGINSLPNDFVVHTQIYRAGSEGHATTDSLSRKMAGYNKQRLGRTGKKVYA